MAIHVFPQRQPVEMRVPLKCSWREIDSFLKSREAWIASAVDELASTPVKLPPRYIDGATHDYMGVPYTLVTTHASRVNVSLRSGQLIVRGPSPNSESAVRRHVENWYRDEAQNIFHERIRLCRGRFAATPRFKSLTVRKMKARWGSCSSQGVINLNTLLVRMPLSAIDLVITHELCHLTHFHHNRAFYELLSSAMPDWRAREKLLGNH